jgi:iron complex outermembrane receptor protein
MKNNSALKSGISLTLGLTLAATASPGIGQELEEVLVTARKREENMQRVPIAVSAVSAKTIADAGLARLQDVTDLIPNMTHQETISNKATNLTLRGISSSGGLGNDPAIGVYVDEVYVSRESGFNADLLDIERVEVLKGPQGTLFGRNTAVGALNITTRKPGEEIEGMVLVDLGDYSYERYGALFSAPFTDTFAGKISVVSTERDGYLDNSFGGTVNTVDYTTVRAQLLWAPTDTLEFLLTGDYREDESDGNNLVTRTQGEPLNKNYEVDIPDSGSEDVEAEGLSLRITYDWNDYLVTSITSGNSIDEDYVNDQDWSPLDALLGLDTRENDQWSQELRISSPGDGRLTWVAGLYYFHQEFDALQHTINGPDTVFAAVGLDDLVGSGIPPSDFGLPDTVEIIANSTIESDSYAAFANVDYEFNDHWSVNAGIRYSKDEKDLDYTQTADPLAVAFGFVPLDIQDDIEDDEWTPTVSLNWLPTEDFMGYAKYSRGYKAGGFNNSISSTASALAFDGETMDAYEVGLKSTWMDNRLRVNAAAFYMEYDDKQESAFVSGIGFVQTNAGSAESEGFELEVEFVAVENWLIYGSVGYADASYDEFIVDEVTDHSGNTLTRAPEWTFNIGSQADWSLTDYLRLMLRVDYSYQDEFFTQANNDPFFAADSQNLVHARLGLSDADQNWEATLWGRNLTDDDNINTIDGPSTFFFPTYHYSLVAPRTYGVELKYNF